MVAVAAPRTDRVFNVRSYGARGDGTTDDRATIQATVDAASSAGGGDVYFPPGTYLCLCASGASINLYGVGSVRFVGHGRSSVVKMSPSSDSNPILFRNVGSGATSQSDIAFELLTMDIPNVTNAIGINMSSTASRITVRGCHFVGLKAGAIRPAGTDILIANNTFYGGSVGGYGILANNSSTLKGMMIVGNVIDGNGGGADGIDINQPSVSAATNILISENVIHGYLSGSPTAGMGIALANCTDTIVSGNTVFDCYLDGIHVEDRSERVSIVGNTIHANQGYGISVQGVTDDANVNKGIVIANNVVSGVCTTRSDAGILLGAPYQSAHGFSVVGNQVNSVGRSGAAMYGIAVSRSRHGTVQGNVVKNTTGSDTSGMYLHILEDVSVIGNRSYDDQGTPTQDYGVKVGGAMTRVLIANNHLGGNATGPLDETSIGATSEYRKLLNSGIAPATVSGSRGANAALADLLTELAGMGLVTDSTS